jgi:hypothetical protein
MDEILPDTFRCYNIDQTMEEDRTGQDATSMPHRKSIAVSCGLQIWITTVYELIRSTLLGAGYVLDETLDRPLRTAPFVHSISWTLLAVTSGYKRPWMMAALTISCQVVLAWLTHRGNDVSDRLTRGPSSLDFFGSLLGHSQVPYPSHMAVCCLLIVPDLHRLPWTPRSLLAWRRGRISMDTVIATAQLLSWFGLVLGMWYAVSEIHFFLAGCPR